ncbi:MAG: MFS transporter [Candidatus Binatia bacterium]|jgi:putative MFS transporter
MTTARSAGPGGAPRPSIAARVERLPLVRFHYRFIALISLGAFFDFFDIFMMAYIGAALQASGFLGLEQFSVLIAAGFLGMFAGTVVFGIGSDRFGRRTSFVLMLLVYSAFTLAGAFSPDATWLIVTRALAGVGIGAELVVIDTYVTEIVPGAYRGRFVAITQLVGFCAIPVAALLSRVLLPTHEGLDGWRWILVIGALGGVFAWWIRRGVPESPRWLESVGRTDEAERVMAEIERQVEADHGGPLPAPGALRVERAERVPVRELFGPAYRSRTIMLLVFHLLQTVGIYGFANWAPTFLLRQGESLGSSLEYSFLIALVSPVGPLLGVLTAERFERKRSIVVLSTLMAVTGLAFPFARSAVAIVAIGALFTIFSYWFSSAFHAYQAELFPTRARATGVGFTYSMSRLSAVFSTLIIGALLVRGVFAVFVFMAAAMLGVALVVGVFGPRTNARALEDISH